ncbi:MAG: amidophosphoribosyltransferase [Lentisphaerae bacterium]|nr:MAG: amidophosphoribosyltransferase [Lentisphaerota bacterium]
MAEDIHHECGIAAIYLLDEPYNNGDHTRIIETDDDILPLLPRVMLDLQNRGQLAAGFSTYNPNRVQLLDTYKDLGTVREALRMGHVEKHKRLLEEYAGRAAIGHTRYATVGRDDVRYAQPFERHHGRRWKWFSFAFNGTLANYNDLRASILAKQQYHFTMDTDTEIIMHLLSYGLRGDEIPELPKVMAELACRLDGAFNIVFLDALGRMMVVRDPLGIRPLAWAVEGRLFAAASESTALFNLGFTEIHSLKPGEMALIKDGKLSFHQYAPSPKKSRCFFEWIYFANVGSDIDGISAYSVRAKTGEILAKTEEESVDEDTIVVPVPDTAKAAADAFAFHLKVPCVEGIIRNRYVGRTFIQSTSTRNQSVRSKYTMLPSVLKGKKVFLVEDSIVRSTTMRALANQLYEIGGAREIHVRVACPPIVAPCFYGIDMSTISELFAPPYFDPQTQEVPPEMFPRMAAQLNVDSLRYLTCNQLFDAIDDTPDSICRGCIQRIYPTPWGHKLFSLAAERMREGKCDGRTFE